MSLELPNDLIRLDNSCVERGRRKSEIQYPTNPEMVV